jgi:hypothetical protein
LTCPEEVGEAVEEGAAGVGPPLAGADFEGAALGLGLADGLSGAPLDGSARRVEDASGRVSGAVAPATVMGRARGGS